MNEQIKAAFLDALSGAETLDELEDVYASFPEAYQDALSDEVDERREALTPDEPVALDELTASELFELIEDNEDLKADLAPLFADSAEDEEDEEEETEDSEEEEKEDSAEDSETNSTADAEDESGGDEADEKEDEDDEKEDEEEETEDEEEEEEKKAEDEQDDDPDADKADEEKKDNLDDPFAILDELELGDQAEPLREALSNYYNHRNQTDEANLNALRALAETQGIEEADEMNLDQLVAALDAAMSVRAVDTPGHDADDFRVADRALLAFYGGD